MSAVSGTFQALGVSLRNALRPRRTEPLPWKGSRRRARRLRQGFALLRDEHGEEACIGCRMCERICPSQVITVVPGGRRESPVTGKKRGYCRDFALDLNACIACELCVQVCPTDAIVMLRLAQPPAFSREELLLTRERLLAAGGLGEQSWATGSRLVAMQDPGR